MLGANSPFLCGLLDTLWRLDLVRPDTFNHVWDSLESKDDPGF
jgi:hypothetical protein